MRAAAENNERYENDEGPGALKKIDNIGGGRNAIDFWQPIQSPVILSI